ncbi:hypothetical protein ACJX0J_028795, partial [Zea mays]
SVGVHTHGSASHSHPRHPPLIPTSAVAPTINGIAPAIPFTSQISCYIQGSGDGSWPPPQSPSTDNASLPSKKRLFLCSNPRRWWHDARSLDPKSRSPYPCSLSALPFPRRVGLLVRPPIPRDRWSSNSRGLDMPNLKKQCGRFVSTMPCPRCFDLLAMGEHNGHVPVPVIGPQKNDEELGNPVPKEPILFLKLTLSFLHAGVATIAVEILETLESLHHMVELAVVISRRGHDVPEASTMDFVRGNLRILPIHPYFSILL